FLGSNLPFFECEESIHFKKISISQSERENSSLLSIHWVTFELNHQRETFIIYSDRQSIGWTK
ncbi:hypothetical protein OAV88_01790, partial [bacterium]|nr:hypothetical protein [bacterium]